MDLLRFLELTNRGMTRQAMTNAHHSTINHLT